ncbi:ABC transporter ATP-binding protein [Eleftheria terrae]|uniref:ABC transporter ATP-binding protein n=1 Tax=Eleftheria terrae TaxID=1597781 RepID=UPI00263A7762|nr:ABC transporter ATP-binding protein [Eleftheria terrae]WKB55708.1 ABC transporter ATP-binding protein [Eleftheria terrae]
MIELSNISKTYWLGNEPYAALDRLALQVGRNEMVALTGASGSGKSTLMNILGCLDTPTEGSYRLDGQEVAALDEDQLAAVRNRKIGFVFQNFHLVPRVPAWANVAQPLIYRGVAPAERRRRAEAALQRVGLGARLNHKPNELSGGQRQRVAIARALVGRPELLLADEPTGNLDSRTADEIMALLKALHAEGLTLVIVTHEPDIAAQCRRVVRLQDGHIVDDRHQLPSGAAEAAR